MEEELVHTHKSCDGSEYSHTHSAEHKHNHENTISVLNRLSRAIGHLESVKRMVEDGRDCSEVLIQMSAVIAALNSTSKIIIKDHMQHCIIDALEAGDKTAIESLSKAIDRFIK